MKPAQVMLEVSMLAEEIRTRRFALRSDVVATLLEDGAVLLDLESKFFYRLNSSGWFIVQQFENGATIIQVMAACRTSGAAAADERDITLLIDALLQDRLIEVSDDDPGAQTSVASVPWVAPVIEKQAQPLQKVIISAFDPSVPLVE